MGRADPLAGGELDVELLRAWPLPSDPEGDKFTRGTLLVIGGSESTPGAVMLAGRAALRAGAGRLQIATVPEVATAVAVAVPESKVVSFTAGELAGDLAGASCVLIGPGLPAGDESLDRVRQWLEMLSEDAVVVLDAAAIQAIRGVPSATIARLRGRIVLTPNRQELRELLDAEIADDEAVAQVASRFGAVVTSFGTVCAHDGRCWTSAAGHPALGTSGSGDVAAGLIAGIAARTGGAEQAACWGTLLHVLAGERLGRQQEPLGFLAHALLDAVDGRLLER